MKKILTDYVDTPYFEIKCYLEGEYILFIKWNIFNDKKDGNKLVLRPRYTLKNKNGVRKSLKMLNLTKPVEFKQMYIDDNKLNILKNAECQSDKEVIIDTFFGSWINKEFIDMINSGYFKIVLIETVEEK